MNMIGVFIIIMAVLCISERVSSSTNLVRGIPSPSHHDEETVFTFEHSNGLIYANEVNKTSVENGTDATIAKRRKHKLPYNSNIDQVKNHKSKSLSKRNLSFFVILTFTVILLSSVLLYLLYQSNCGRKKMKTSMTQSIRVCFLRIWRRYRYGDMHYQSTFYNQAGSEDDNDDDVSSTTLNMNTRHNSIQTISTTNDFSYINDHLNGPDSCKKTSIDNFNSDINNAFYANINDINDNNSTNGTSDNNSNDYNKIYNNGYNSGFDNVYNNYNSEYILHKNRQRELETKNKSSISLLSYSSINSLTDSGKKKNISWGHSTSLFPPIFLRTGSETSSIFTNSSNSSNDGLYASVCSTPSIPSLEG
jgi:hypothetical protein